MTQFFEEFSGLRAGCGTERGNKGGGKECDQGSGIL